MKNLNKLNVTVLAQNELVTVDGGSVDPDALKEYIAERYPYEVANKIYK